MELFKGSRSGKEKNEAKKKEGKQQRKGKLVILKYMKMQTI